MIILFKYTLILMLIFISISAVIIKAFATWLVVPQSIHVPDVQICEAHLQRTAFGQLTLPSLTLLSVASCGRLQLGAAYWATSVALLQVVDN